MSAAQAAREFEGIVQTQAVMLATDHMFFIISFMLFGAAASIWLAPRRPKGAKGAAGGL